MGAKQTKIEGSYLPDTPTLQRISIQPDENMQQNYLTVQTDFNNTPVSNGDPLDPRSPSGCRTPINILNKQNIQLQQQQQSAIAVSLDNPLNMLRKRFFKGFSYSLHDPRSPSMQLNRTPLLFDEANDRTLNLDDTFSDLFVDSRAPNAVVEPEPDVSENVEEADEAMQVDTASELISQELEQSENASIEINSFISAVGDEEETMPCPAKLQYTPLVLQQQLDPRSPTIGVDRTPIIFNDDDEANEDAMLENILATLSLNLSSSSSVVSFNAATTPVHKTCISEQPVMRLTEGSKPLANKHLERVRRNGGRQHQRMSHKQPKLAQQRRQKIFEDRENTTASPAKITPKKRYNNDEMESARKRTPLSCVKNQTHLRSRSVELSGKSLKTRLPLSSFDDSLSSLTNAKHTNMRMLQGFEDSLEL